MTVLWGLKHSTLFLRKQRAVFFYSPCHLFGNGTLFFEACCGGLEEEAGGTEEACRGCGGSVRKLKNHSLAILR